MRKFPLMGLPIALYNLIAFGFLFSGGADIAAPWLHLGMPTMGGQWSISVADLVIFAGLGCLFIEILKSTSTSDSSITNHVLGMLVLIVAIVEFLLMPPFATSAFFSPDCHVWSGCFGGLYRHDGRRTQGHWRVDRRST